MDTFLDSRKILTCVAGLQNKKETIEAIKDSIFHDNFEQKHRTWGNNSPTTLGTEVRKRNDDERESCE